MKSFQAISSQDVPHIRRDFVLSGERSQGRRRAREKLLRVSSLQQLIRKAVYSFSRAGTASSETVTFEVAFETRRCLETEFRHS